MIEAPAETAAAPEIKPLQSDLISYLGNFLCSPITMCLFSRKHMMDEVDPDKNVFKSEASAWYLLSLEFKECLPAPHPFNIEIPMIIRKVPTTYKGTLVA